MSVFAGAATLVISPKPVTISGITAENKKYDGTTTATVKTDNAIFNGILEGDALSITATGTFADADAGDNKTVNLSLGALSGADMANYTLATTGNQSTTTASIKKATPLLAPPSGLTATYGDKLSSITLKNPSAGYMPTPTSTTAPMCWSSRSRHSSTCVQVRPTAYYSPSRRPTTPAAHNSTAT